MKLPNPTTPFGLPSTEQLMSAPERALLAALDANLELTARLLMAEHVDLLPDGRRSRDPDYEPFTFDLLPKAEALVLGARRLRKRIADYCAVEDRLLSGPRHAGALPGTKRHPPDDDIPV